MCHGYFNVGILTACICMSNNYNDVLTVGPVNQNHEPSGFVYMQDIEFIGSLLAQLCERFNISVTAMF